MRFQGAIKLKNSMDLAKKPGEKLASASDDVLKIFGRLGNSVAVWGTLSMYALMIYPCLKVRSQSILQKQSTPWHPHIS